MMRIDYHEPTLEDKRRKAGFWMAVGGFLSSVSIIYVFFFILFVLPVILFVFYVLFCIVSVLVGG